MSLSLFATVLLAAGTFSEQQVDEIQLIIRDYLVEEPEVLIQASQALQEKQLKAMKEQADEVIEEKAGILFAGTSPILGNENGTINVVEFFDYQCGHCKVVHGVLNSLIDNNQDVRLIVKPMPVLAATSV
ncbi:MAG: thioredoxin domain-containing protein, partial [Chlamydiia bacterium]|nr:thioredoxin domain-containing protein [Chlamydiia bacterium]